MSSQPQLAVRICTALNIIAVTVWVLFLLERSSWGRTRVSDYGTALGSVAVFFVVPLAAAGGWWLHHRRRESLSGSNRRYLRMSALFLSATWVFSWIPMIFWAGILSAVASHVWPINIREGPDTSFAKERFQEHFGFPPTGVGGLYCRRSWEFGDGNTYRFKFQSPDPAILESIVRAAALEPVPENELKTSWVIESDQPAWWPAPGFSGFDQAFRRHSRPRMWVDRTNNIVYYRSWP